MKVKARQRGVRNPSAQSQQASQPGQKHYEQLVNESQDLSLNTEHCEGHANVGGSASSSSAASVHTPRSVPATSPHASASSVVPAAASRPPLLIGTTSAAARLPPPPSRALTQQQLRRQRQQQRATLPPVRARGASASASRQASGVGGAIATGANAAGGAWTTAAGAAATSAAGGKTCATSTAALNEAVKVVERALDEGPEGQERLRRLSLDQPDLYSQVILALFRKTQSLELISRMPMPMMPEPDLMMDPPIPGADFNLDLASWEEGEELDYYWEVMEAEGGLYKGGVDGFYDMPYDLDDVDAPFPEPPFPDFDYDPGFDHDEEDELYDEDEYYYDESEGEGAGEEGYGYLEGEGVAHVGSTGGFNPGEDEREGKYDEVLQDEQRAALVVSCGAVKKDCSAVAAAAAAKPRHGHRDAVWRADGAAVYDGEEEETLSRDLRDLHVAPKPLYPIPS